MHSFKSFAFFALISYMYCVKSYPVHHDEYIGGCNGTYFGCCKDNVSFCIDIHCTECTDMYQVHLNNTFGGCHGSYFGCCKDNVSYCMDIHCNTCINNTVV